MPKMKQHPRYNVFPFRATDQEAKEIQDSVPRGQRAAFFLEAVLEKIRRDRQRRIDHALSKRAL